MSTAKGDEKVPWNLSVNKELKRLVKIQCAIDGTDVSDVTEGLYREFLKKTGVALRASEKPGSYKTKRGKK